MSAAIEALAAAHHGAGAALEAADIAGWKIAVERSGDFAPRHQLAMTDDVDAEWTLIGPGVLLAEIGDRGPDGFGLNKAAIARVIEAGHMLRDAKRPGEAR